MSEAARLEEASDCSCSSWNEKDVFSKLLSYSMKPSFGSVACLCVFTNSKASSSFIEKSRMMNMITLVADLDMPIAQCTMHFDLKLAFYLLIWRKSFWMRTYSVCCGPVSTSVWFVLKLTFST